MYFNMYFLQHTQNRKIILCDFPKVYRKNSIYCEYCIAYIFTYTYLFMHIYLRHTELSILYKRFL